MRMHMRRFTRLTNAFSKKIENHAARSRCIDVLQFRPPSWDAARDARYGRWRDRSALGRSATLVAVIEAWEAEQATAGITYEVGENRIGDGFYVKALPRYSEPMDAVYGFENQGRRRKLGLRPPRQASPGPTPQACGAELMNCPTTRLLTKEQKKNYVLCSFKQRGISHGPQCRRRGSRTSVTHPVPGHGRRLSRGARGAVSGRACRVGGTILRQTFLCAAGAAAGGQRRLRTAVSNHSITSSAVASNVGGTARPRVLAVLRLIANSNFVGCCTGRSAGLTPLSIRST